MKWTIDQEKIIDARDCNLLVSAAAGSGKTAVLVERIIRMISDKDNPINVDELLVVTFTKAAAAQMRDKITIALEKMLEQEPANEHFIRQLNYIHKANILTIDSFCYQVVKEYFHAIGIDPGVRVGETGELGLLREEVLEEVIEEFYEINPDFVQFSDAFSADKTDTQIEGYIMKVYDICSSYPRPSEWIRKAKESLCVKTEEEFIALPVVQQYFGEIRESAKGIKEEILLSLKRIRDIDGPLHMEKALLSDVTMVDDLISAKNYTQFHSVAQCKFETLARGKKGEFDEEIAEEIKKLRDLYKKQIIAIQAMFQMPFEMVLEQFRKQEKMLIALLDVTERFRERFLEEKLKRSILEFSDVEHFALQILCKEYDEDGNPLPSDIGKELSEDFKEILIDEYQDSNFLQEAILKCVSKLHQGNNNMFMVGDVKQSIYSFRMARPDLFMEKYDTYDTEIGADCRKLLLKNNFRSRANVLESINYMFYQIMGKDLGGIDYSDAEALVPGREFPNSMNDNVELLIGESKGFEFLKMSDEEMTARKEETLDENLEDIGKKELEATIVAKRILSMLGKDGSEPYQVIDETTGQMRNLKLSDIVILFRAPTGFQQIFSEVLMGHQIPVRVQNESGYLDATEIELVLSLLHVVDNPFQDVEVAAILRSYFGGFQSDELALIILIKRYLDKYQNNNKKEEIEKESPKNDERKRKKLHLYQVVKALAAHGNHICIPGTNDTEENIIKSDIISDLESYLERVLSVQMEDYRTLVEQKICKKCIAFVELIENLLNKRLFQKVSKVLSDIYYETGYYHYVKVMPEGNQRIRNLELLYEECRNFENGGVKTLFEFLIYLQKIKKKSISLGGDPAPETTDEVVRIMSIHKSKGLEFPVVFVSGTGKNFNLMDTKAPLIIHSDYYVGAKYIDTDRRCGNDTFMRKSMASLMVTESIAEELRILYVALTRAKEKLIMTAVTPDITSLVKKYENIATRKEQKLPYSVIHTAKNYLDMITMSFIRNTAFHKTMCNVRSRLDDKTGEIISAKYTLDSPMVYPDIRLEAEVYDFYDLAVQHVQSGMEQQINREQKLLDLLQAPSKLKAQIEEQLSWKYEKEAYTMQRSKLSVTEIKRMYETEDELTQIMMSKELSKEEYVAPKPRFVEGEKPMDAAMKGTWMHKLMELFPNAEVTTREQVEIVLDEMWSAGRLPEETKQFITTDKVYAFVTSNLGKRMHEADKQGKLFKEKQFVVGVSAKRLFHENSDMNASEEIQEKLQHIDDWTTPIVVQGIIDAYFQESDKLILLDYKTDQVKEGQEETLVKRYETQLRYYKDTLEQLTGLEVAETYIYSFALGKEILMSKF